MTYVLIILKVQVRLKKKIGLFCKKLYFYNRNISLYHDILGQCINTFKFCIVPSLVLTYLQQRPCCWGEIEYCCSGVEKEGPVFDVAASLVKLGLCL